MYWADNWLQFIKWNARALTHVLYHDDNDDDHFDDNDDDRLVSVGILFIIWAKRGVWRKVWYFADGHLSLPLYLPPTRAYKNICFQMIRQEKLLRKDSVISIVCNKFMSKFTSSSIYMYLIYTNNLGQTLYWRDGWICCQYKILGRGLWDGTSQICANQK